MKLVLLAACFLFFCQHGPYHRPVHSHDACAMVKDFNNWGNQDDYVKSFPTDEQHRVLVCLDKLAKKQGRQ